MNIQAIEHIPESKYCFALDANTIKIRLRVAKEDNIDKINILFGCKYDFSMERFSKTLRKTHETNLFAYYETTLNLKDVRLVYIFEIYENNQKYYFSEDGITNDYDFKNSFYNAFQYSYINKNDLFPCVDWLKTATFYQIFVDRFNIGDDKKDKSYINLKWGDIPSPKSFAGGDLKGIIQKLDYIKNIGFNAIYLTPIFSSISNHKYDTKDYFHVDEQFGDEFDLSELVNNAHKLGMKVVLDAVFNHCSDEIEQYQDVLKNGKNSKYFNWFVYKNENTLEVETFAHCEYMPKLNTANPEVQDYLIKIALHYINVFDIDGWRLDVSDEVSHNFWKKFRIAVKKTKPDCVIIGENWHDAQSFLRGDEFDSIMNYAFTKACLDYFAFNKFNAKEMSNKLNELLMRNNDHTNLMMLNLLDSHDTLRFLTEVKENKDKLYCALALLYFYVGVPCLYYGTEIDMVGGYDPDSRRTYNWSYKNHDTIELIQKLSSLKREGYLENPNMVIHSSGELLTLKCNSKDYDLILTINNTEKEISYSSKDVIIGHNYNKKVIKPFGFMIEKRRSMNDES